MMKHWNWLLPLVLVGIFYFTYNSPSFVGNRLRAYLAPLIEGITGLVANLLGL